MIRNLPQGFTRIKIEYEKPITHVSVLDHDNGEWAHCLSIEKELDFNGYFLVSASSGVSVPDSVFLNSLKVFDPLKANTNHHF